MPIPPQQPDTVDRLAPDFVTVGLIVCEPGEILYSVIGHACLHLQCPTFDMDYYFSYESESVEGKVLQFLLNNLKMGMAQITPEDFLQTYIDEGRGVKEYRLNLPPEVKTELWRMCDERVAQGMRLDYDPVKRGCAVSIVHCIDDAIRSANRATGSSYHVQYEPWGDKGKRTIREIFYENAAKNWGLFWCTTIVAGKYIDNPRIPNKEKLIAPLELAERWHHASIDGTPLISQEPIILAPSVKVHKGSTFTPLMAALALLLLSIVGWVLKKDFVDYLYLPIYAVFALLITYLVVFTSLPNTDWNWLIIPFNILPLLAWHWRKYWALPYASVIIIWSLVMLYYFIFDNLLVDVPNIIFALSFAMLLIKQSFAKTLHVSKKSSTFAANF